MKPAEEVRPYRLLQKHLDDQAVGFPATRSGAEIVFLKRMFSPREAGLALHLTYRPSSMDEIMETAAGEFSEEESAELLESMSMRGSIGFRESGGQREWFLLPLVIGMFEAQDGKPTRGFLRDVGKYMKTMTYGKSLLATEPSQMRTIPINASIPVEHEVATYDQVTELIESSPGPFVILPCICRESSKLQGKTCEVTSREETCLGIGDTAAMVLSRGHGRKIDRKEAIEILQMNQEDGLVLQPGNSQDPDFICSCCGCCCGMLTVQKMLPHPVDFWTCTFQAVVDRNSCTGCGICVKRCQVGAVKLKGSPARAYVSESRCIGCGLCVPKCPAGAIELQARDDAGVPPDTAMDLYDTIMANKKGAVGRFLMFLKIILRMRK